MPAMRVRESRCAGAAVARLSGAVVMAVALGTGTAACGSGCQETTLTARPLTVNSPRDLLDLSARLTSEGKPVRGELVNFFSTVRGGPENGSGHVIGSATTDASGVAQISRPDTLAEALLPGGRLVGYVVEFDGLFPGKVNYCPAKIHVRVTSDWTAPP
jgi:hypothetical protein